MPRKSFSKKALTELYEEYNRRIERDNTFIGRQLKDYKTILYRDFFNTVAEEIRGLINSKIPCDNTIFINIDHSNVWSSSDTIKFEIIINKPVISSELNEEMKKIKEMRKEHCIKMKELKERVFSWYTSCIENQEIIPLENPPAPIISPISCYTE